MSTLKHVDCPGQVAQLFNAWSLDAKVTGSITNQHIQESTNEYINKWNNKSMFLFLSFSLFLPPLKSINKIFKIKTWRLTKKLQSRWFINSDNTSESSSHNFSIWSRLTKKMSNCMRIFWLIKRRMVVNQKDCQKNIISLFLPEK